MKNANYSDMRRIFAGKKEFHKAVANLPIKEKLRIVAALQRIDYSIKPEKWKRLMMWPSVNGQASVTSFQRPKSPVGEGHQ
ncbi:MAG: hypothetical protein KKH28_02170 [Elusimicrobia bacterium]|nr:hypothetical protein [Elusimicrobiota bacterium]